jgi:polyribonucleotide nucleotidyltransferase
VQVIVTLISSDEQILPDAIACLAASAALAVSDIPIKEVISEVRVCKINGEFKITLPVPKLKALNLILSLLLRRITS